MKKFLFLLLPLCISCWRAQSPQVLGTERILLYNSGEVVSQGGVEDFASEEVFCLQNILGRVALKGHQTLITYVPQLLFLSDGWTLDCHDTFLVLNLKRTKTAWMQLVYPLEQEEQAFFSRIKGRIKRRATIGERRNSFPQE